MWNENFRHYGKTRIPWLKQTFFSVKNGFRWWIHLFEMKENRKNSAIYIFEIWTLKNEICLNFGLLSEKTASFSVFSPLFCQSILILMQSSNFVDTQYYWVTKIRYNLAENFVFPSKKSSATKFQISLKRCESMFICHSALNRSGFSMSISHFLPCCISYRIICYRRFFFLSFVSFLFFFQYFLSYKSLRIVWLTKQIMAIQTEGKVTVYTKHTIHKNTSTETHSHSQ